MGLLLRFGILITPSSEFQFSSVTGLTIITTLKLMNLVLHWLILQRWRINQIHSF